MRASDLVRRVFLRHVGPLCDKDGVNEFLAYAAPGSMGQRARLGHAFILAWKHDEPVGLIEVRDYHHISLLFVDTDHQRRGIGRQLLRRALCLCREKHRDVRQVDVNVSPNAVRAYERLGFRQQAPERTEDGIRFVPMVLDLEVHGE